MNNNKRKIRREVKVDHVWLWYYMRITWLEGELAKVEEDV